MSSKIHIDILREQLTNIITTHIFHYQKNYREKKLFHEFLSNTTEHRHNQQHRYIMIQ